MAGDDRCQQREFGVIMIVNSHFRLASSRQVVVHGSQRSSQPHPDVLGPRFRECGARKYRACMFPVGIIRSRSIKPLEGCGKTG